MSASEGTRNSPIHFQAVSQTMALSMNRKWLASLAVLFLFVVASLGGTQERPRDDGMGNMIVRKDAYDSMLQDLATYHELAKSPKKHVSLAIDAPRTVTLKRSEKDLAVWVGKVEFSINITNISDGMYNLRPILIDAAICEEDGREMDPRDWRWNRAFHGITASVNLEPSKVYGRQYFIVFQTKTPVHRKKYHLVACYLNRTEGKYATADFEAIVEKDGALKPSSKQSPAPGSS
jgi:hypothetical protein